MPAPSKPPRASRTSRSLADELSGLLTQRGWSLRELARRIGIDPTFLSRALRGVRSKSISGPLAGRIAEALELPIDYFPEFRRDYIVQRLDADKKVLDEVYEWIRAGETPKTSSIRENR